MSFFTFARILAVLILSTLLAFMAPTLFAAQVTLTWDTVNASTLAGYKVYYGTTSREYSSFIDVKKVTTYTVTGLSDGTTYYFAATAYSNAGESGYSGEVSFSTPKGVVCTFSLAPSSASFSPLSGSGNITVTAPAGCNWTSSTPPIWISVTSGATGTGNGMFKYSVAANTATSSRTAALTIAGQVLTVTQNGQQSSTITASATSGGKISPAGTVQVTYGSNQTFSISRYPGYIIADVKVDGVSVGKVTSYTFSNVTANHTITASFSH